MQCYVWLVGRQRISGLYLCLSPCQLFSVTRIQPHLLFSEARGSAKVPSVAGLGEVEVTLVQDHVPAVQGKGDVVELELVFLIHSHL